MREWRKHQNLTVEKLAELAKVSPGLVSQIENRKTSPSRESLEKLSKVLRCAPGDIISRPPGHSPDIPILAVWERATEGERAQLMRVAEAMIPKRD